MINSKISSAIVIRSFRHSTCRNINLQRNLSKVSIRSLRYNSKNQSCFPLLSGHSVKSLLYVPASSNLESQRNFLSTQDIQKDLESEKKDAAVETSRSIIDPELIFGNFGSIFDNISFSSLLNFLETHIAEIHELTGLPWWGSIAFTAFLMRTSIVLPVAAGQIIFMTRVRKIDVDVQKLVPALREKIVHDQKKFGWTDEIAKKKLNIEIKKRWNGLVYNNDCHPVKKYILPAVQVPIWLTCTLAIRNLCIPNPSDVSNEVYSELSTGGFAWITNLTDVDHFMILPITIGVVNLLIIEVHQLFQVEAQKKQDQRTTMFFRAVSLGLVPVAAYMPAATNIYWLTSSLYGLVQSFFLHSAMTRKLLALPVPEREQKYPYRLFKKNLQLRLGMKSSKADDAEKPITSGKNNNCIDMFDLPRQKERISEKLRHYFPDNSREKVA